MVIISVAIRVLKAIIKCSTKIHIFTIETKEDARISASEIKVIQQKASEIWLSFLCSCILLLQSYTVGCSDCRFSV